MALDKCPDHGHRRLDHGDIGFGAQRYFVEEAAASQAGLDYHAGIVRLYHVEYAVAKFLEPLFRLNYDTCSGSYSINPMISFSLLIRGTSHGGFIAG